MRYTQRHMTIRPTHYLAAFILTTVASTVLAEEASVPDTASEFHMLQQTDPNNLDKFFSLANHAAGEGDIATAVKALEYMLQQDPSLARVKLDLGLLYIQQNKPQEAKKLFEEVLATNPPEEVQNNVKTVLEKTNKMLQKHMVSGAVTVGLNYDTNANSSASSGQVTFNDISIPLEDNSLKQRDTQGFVAANATHTYRMTDYKTEWQNSAMYYRTEQVSLDQLDLTVYSLRTGPIYTRNEKEKYSGNISYSYIELDGFEYLDVTTFDAGMDYQATQQLMFSPRLTFEYREFVNSPFSSTYSERSGNAIQLKQGMTYVINEKNMVNGDITLRREATKREYNDNDQLALNLSHTYLFTPDTFLNSSLGIRYSWYDGPDPFVSATETRDDVEKTAGIALGKKWDHGIITGLNYQYRRVDSNIQNYEYNNHRFGATVTKLLGEQ